MAIINKRYANYYNTKYCFTGHVYEKRFFDKIILGKEGMLKVSRYIHLNPVKAKMVKCPENYPWSSYAFFKFPNLIAPSYVNINHLLDCCEGTLEERRERYCSACHSPNIVDLKNTTPPVKGHSD